MRAPRPLLLLLLLLMGVAMGRRHRDDDHDHDHDHGHHEDEHDDHAHYGQEFGEIAHRLDKVTARIEHIHDVIRHRVDPARVSRARSVGARVQKLEGTYRLSD